MSVRTTPDEASIRRPDFVGGPTVLLADGQLWHFARPSLRYRIHVDKETRLPVYRPEPSEDWISADYCEALDSLHDLSNRDWFPRVAGLALQLLARNYDLTDEMVPQLLTYEPGSGTSDRMWAAIRAAVTGQLGPK